MISTHRNLASDNNAGIHPLILEALSQANQGHALGYGDDPWTKAMEKSFQQHFGPETQVFPVLTGTAANVLSLATVLRPFEAVLCSSVSHLYTDECGAPERFLGSKLIPLPETAGKISPESLERHLHPDRDVHRVQPRILSITQPTELGTLYSLEEIRTLAELLHTHGLYLHMDGARIANAVVALNTSFTEMVTACGVDLLSFGGSKNGLFCGEAVVVLRPTLAQNFGFIRKQGMQLQSKLRFVSVQLQTYLDSGLWADNARRANQMAATLASGVASIPEIPLIAPVQTNALFARLPQAWTAPLQEIRYFYIWQDNIVRWMTAFDTEQEDIDALLQALQARSKMEKEVL